VIKLMATGSELTPGTASHLPQFAADELRAAVDEARRHNLPPPPTPTARPASPTPSPPAWT